MIAALSWIPRGVARPVPEAAEYTENELAAAREAEGGAPLAERGGKEASLISLLFDKRHCLLLRRSEPGLVMKCW